MLAQTWMANPFPLLAADELKVGVLKIIQDVNKLRMEGRALQNIFVQAGTPYGNLAGAHIVERLGRQFCKAVKDFANDICWEIYPNFDSHPVGVRESM